MRQNAAASNLPTAVSSTNIAYDVANELTRWNSATTNLTYDNNGNLLAETQSGVTTTYAWDGRNRLTGISRAGLTAAFVYDGFGRRQSRTINGSTVGFWYDANDVYAELAGATPSATYIRGLSVDDPFLRKGASDEFYEIDALGTVVGLTNAAGASQTTYTYKPFGNTTQAGSASSNSFQYTGREDDVTGVYYYRSRYYNPRIQRFISEDPIGFSGGDLNVYAYVANDPLGLTDPSGLLFGGFVNAGECFGDSATQFWADMAESSGNSLYMIPGSISALWTPLTSDDTLATLAAGAGSASLIKRAGAEWSHWIPSRYSDAASKYYKGLPRWVTENPLNGNYRSIMEHAKNDIWRARGFGREFMQSKMNSFLLQQWNRLPDTIKGLGMAGAAQASKSKTSDSAGCH